MDQVTKLVSLGQKWVRLGNFCWVYLWVTCLSELCDATGTKLIPQFWLLWILSPSMISQPIPPPSAKAGSIWRAAIQSTFCHPWIHHDCGIYHCLLLNVILLSMVIMVAIASPATLSLASLPDTVIPISLVSSLDGHITVCVCLTHYMLIGQSPVFILEELNSLLGWRQSWIFKSQDWHTVGWQCTNNSLCLHLLLTDSLPVTSNGVAVVPWRIHSISRAWPLSQMITSHLSPSILSTPPSTVSIQASLGSLWNSMVSNPILKGVHLEGVRVDSFILDQEFLFALFPAVYHPHVIFKPMLGGSISWLSLKSLDYATRCLLS